MKFAIVGAGFTGSVLANQLAATGHSVDIFESRDHVAGNCYTERDSETGILIHRYGPHIFHTDNEDVWRFVNRYSEFVPYINRVKTTAQGQVYSLPINLHTINQFFRKTLNPRQARELVESLSDQSIAEPITFEEQALKYVGADLYEAFLRGYTEKQWGRSPRELPASILKRLPLRFNYDDNYFNHKYQGMPKNGYTEIVERLLDEAPISLHCNIKFDRSDADNYEHVFYTGPIDEWFGYEFGPLGYRTLDFHREVHHGDYQGCAVMNYGDLGVPYTRISEHKHFSPWETHEQTVIYKEFSRAWQVGDIPYYPIRLVNEKAILAMYLERARQEVRTSFLGRLGTYRYLDMDVTIAEALNASRRTLDAISRGAPIPALFVNAL